MKISVWDTYLKREDGKVMHFDILAPTEVEDVEIILGYGKDYLRNKPFVTNDLTSKECRFCHIEHPSEMVINDIKRKGYSIIEMENCT